VFIVVVLFIDIDMLNGDDKTNALRGKTRSGGE